MFRLLFVSTIFFLGCSDGRTGGNRENLPLSNVSYSDRHTYPIVAKAVMPQVAAEFSTDSSVVHALELNTTDISLAKIVESELSETVRFIPRSQVAKEMGQFTDTKTGTPARVLSITCTGGKRKWLRFRVNCSSGADSVVYEVVLRATEHTIGWTVETPKKL